MKEAAADAFIVFFEWRRMKGDQLPGIEVYSTADAMRDRMDALSKRRDIALIVGSHRYIDRPLPTVTSDMEH